MDATQTFANLMKELNEHDAQSLREAKRKSAVTLQQLIDGKLAIVGAAKEGKRILNLFLALGARNIKVLDNNPELMGRTLEGEIEVQEINASNVRNRHVILATHRTLNIYNKCIALDADTVTCVLHLQNLYPSEIEPHEFHINMWEDLTSSTENLHDLYEVLTDSFSVEVLNACISYRLDGDPNVFAGLVDWELYEPTGIDLTAFSKTYVDCGSYDGDSLQIHIKKYPNTVEKVFGFEPDPVTFKRLEENMRPYTFANPINKGVSDCITEMRFSSQQERASVFNENGNIRVPITTLDDELFSEKPTFIKMNIEALEPNALRGATRIIQEWQPALAISAYHRPDHLYSLQKLVESISPGAYDYYLRQHDGGLVETVLYALPKQK